MATIVPVAPTSTGANPTFTAASSGGDVIDGNLGQQMVFVVRNASGSAITVTFAGTVPCSQGFTHNIAVNCPVGDTDIIVPSNAINQTTGNASVTYSATTSITVAAVYDI